LPSIRKIGSRQMSGGRSITAQGSTVFVAMGSAGGLVLDASNPQLIATVAAFPTRGEVNSVVISNGLAFVAAGSAGVQVFDVSNLSNITEEGWFDTDGDARSVTLDGNRVYVADGFAGVKILSFERSSPPTPSAGSRYLQLAEASASLGSAVSVPLILAAEGNENALSGTLAFDPTVVRFTGFALSGGGAGGTVNLNTNSAGRLGFTLSLPAGQAFVSGTQNIASVEFSIVGQSTGIPSPLSWTDAPVRREVVSVAAASLGASFLPGSISTVAGYEAALAGANRVSLTDYVKIGRFAAGLDVPTSAEFQKADCAPRSTSGDGRISLADWVQAGRYAAGLDPLTPVGGPAAPISAATSR